MLLLTALPVPLGLFTALKGPVGLPHQFCSALMTSVVPLYRAPNAFPTTLFWWATLVEIVFAGWLTLKKMPSPACEKPFPVKQFWVTVLFRAPASADVEAKPVSASPERPLPSNVFWLIAEFL